MVDTTRVKRISGSKNFRSTPQKDFCNNIPQEQTSAGYTLRSVWCHFRTCALQQLICSNCLVGAGEERGRDSEAEDLRRFKIDDQLKINRLHDRPAFGRASCLKSKLGIFLILRCR